MLFNSYIFIFLFLPITLFGWHTLNHIKKHNLAIWFLSVMSLLFYGYFNISYSIILIGSIIFNFCISSLFQKCDSSIVKRRLLLIVGLVINLGILGYFKYYDFFIANINSLFNLSFNMKNILLPLGISFFTFQQISFVVDRYRNNAPHYSFSKYTAFVTFFPQLIAGPIVLHSELVPQFEDLSKKKFNSNKFREGICFFVIGLSKKMLIADLLAYPVNFAFDNIAMLDVPSSIIIIVAYAMELLFDFSGYSDMAIGLGKMFGVELPVNFNAPMRAVSVKDFWNRWHITLGRFFTTYVYIPLGGSRKGFSRLLLNTMIVFSLSGLWHGADWTFVIWGLLQGVAICINNIWTRKIKASISSIKKSTSNKLNVTKNIICTFITFSYFCFTLIFFRSNNISDAILYLKRMFSGQHYKFYYTLSKQIIFPEGYIIQKYLEMNTKGYEAYFLFGIFIIILLIALLFAFGKPYSEKIKSRKFGTAYALLISFLFAWCVISLGSVSTFLYFNF